MRRLYCSVHEFDYLGETEFVECPLCKAEFQTLSEEHEHEVYEEKLHNKEMKEV